MMSGVCYNKMSRELRVQDYYKAIGYVCLYKGLGEYVNQIPEGELTLSIFRESYPRELAEALEKAGNTLEEVFSGIYYVRGNVLFDTQIVVTSRLDRKVHSSLRVLSKKAMEMDVRTFLAETERLKDSRQMRSCIRRLGGTGACVRR